MLSLSESLNSTVRLMKLEKEVEADQAVRILLKDMQGRADKTMMEKQQQQQMKKKKHLWVQSCFHLAHPI
eukprot:SAG31_NODE_1396_length_8511_cov_1.939491_9_plen_70_part_00